MALSYNILLSPTKQIRLPLSKIILNSKIFNRSMFSFLSTVKSRECQGLRATYSPAFFKCRLIDSKYDSQIWYSNRLPRFYSNNDDLNSQDTLSSIEYERLVEDALEILAEFIDELLENADRLTDIDVSLSDGILKVFLGNEYGTYVINKQSPNKQIWLSSPFSGPKRFDYINKEWIYKRTGVTLSNLLSEEFSKVLERQIKFPSNLETARY